MRYISNSTGIDIDLEVSNITHLNQRTAENDILLRHTIRYVYGTADHYMLYQNIINNSLFSF